MIVIFFRYNILSQKLHGYQLMKLFVQKKTSFSHEVLNNYGCKGENEGFRSRQLAEICNISLEMITEFMIISHKKEC
jgi:hypothetical protein